ncbi:MAG: class I SAM-dependent methyltransferase [Bdellovibrionales bacterium]|nr:class I SAM-dependent methyltransferase [Bdellovibrionales bacterium]
MSLENLNYPDFVSAIQQQNTPPGALETLKFWLNSSHIDENSRIFDFACSTGFSSRAISRLTSCRGVGVDLSEQAIEQAKSFAEKDGLSGRLQFFAKDVVTTEQLDLGEFSHVIGGSNFSFVQEREKALAVTHRLLCSSGILFTSNYCYHTEPPIELLRELKLVLGFEPKAEWTDTYWSDFFSTKFERLKSKTIELTVLSDQELRVEIEKQLEQSLSYLEMPASEQRACREKYFRIRRVFNENRKFQNIALATWRKKHELSQTA